jgi:hypothetical protein
MTDRYSSAEQRARKHAKELRSFVQHAGSFLAVGLFFLILNLITSPDSLWFFWPLLPWGVGLAIHGWNVLWQERLFNDDWEDRQTEKFLNRQQKPQQSSTDATAPGVAEIGQIMDRSAVLIDGMRASARQIPKADVQRQALDVCAASDQVLSAIGDNPNEVVLARDFLNRYLSPASTILNDYSRLASRNVPSASATLAKVEEHDMPLLTTKMHELYDRLHRGNLIDLEVAREMLSLDVADWGLEELEPTREVVESPRSDKPIASR